MAEKELIAMVRCPTKEDIERLSNAIDEMLKGEREMLEEEKEEK